MLHTMYIYLHTGKSKKSNLCTGNIIIGFVESVSFNVFEIVHVLHSYMFVISLVLLSFLYFI